MQPEEENPGLLVGWHVVEVGVRQAWPFLTFADPASGREVRVYMDAAVRVSPDAVSLRQDDAGLVAALERVNMMTVDDAAVVDGSLELWFEGESVWIDGEENEVTTHTPWWVGLQAPALSRTTGDEASPEVDRSFFVADGDLPSDFTYPADFVWVVRRRLIDVEPWTVLQGEALMGKLYGLRKRYPDSPLVPFARRIDNDDVACWDAGLPDARVVVIHDWASPGWERRAQFKSFTAWFLQAVADCLELGDIESDVR